MENKPMNIFPCRDKRPLTAEGFHDAHPFEHWLPRYAEHDQWGAPCGPSNGFFVVDVDLKHGGVEFAKNFDFGEGFKVPSPGGGYHLYYKYDVDTCGELRPGTNILGSPGQQTGIDLRAEGSYVILYGEIDVTTLHAPPGWLLSVLGKPKPRLADFREADEDAVGEGGRNDYLARAAGRLQRAGVLTMASLSELNDRKCSPPLAASEVEAIFSSVSRYEPDSTPEEDAIPPKKIVWANDLIGDFLEYIRDKGRISGDPTGVEELDNLLGGGKRLGELTVTLAEAKSGKNTLWHYLQRMQLDKGIPLGYASRELTPETEVLPNLLTLSLGKNLYTAKEITEAELVQAMKNWKLAFAPGYGAFQGNELFSWMDECRHFGVLYFYIDHLHYCLPDSEDFKQVAELGRSLKTYAKTHNVHIDLIVQPKGLDANFPQDLDIHHLRGGASLGQVLDNLLTMQRQRDSNGELLNVTKVTLKRSRSKMARPGSFFVQYDRELMTFSVVEESVGTPADEEKEPVSYGNRFDKPPVVSNTQFIDGATAASNMLKRIRIK